MEVTVLNFSGIYEQETFYRDLEGVSFVDLKDISGTNCMCDDEAAKEILARLKDTGKSVSFEASGDIHAKLPYGLHFIDNGNYHYMSALLAGRVTEPFSLVALDHHPDMQRPMFDILSCGGWVAEVLDKNPFVRDVHIIGADRRLIEELDPADRDKVRFYDLDEVFYSDTGVRLPDIGFPVYLSIDKDVVRRDDIVTNWDQGELSAEQLKLFIRALFITEKNSEGRDVLALDICGECAPDQENCDISAAICGNDTFNADIIKLLS